MPMFITLVEKSSKHAVRSTFYRQFQLFHASDNKLVDPTSQPSWKPVFTDGFPKKSPVEIESPTTSGCLNKSVMAVPK